MEKNMPSNTIRIRNAANEEDLTALISSACDRSLAIIDEMWGLKAPVNCGIYVMTSWWQFILDAAPLYMKFLLVRTVPFWAGRAERMWKVAGAWTQKFGSHVAIGVKPPRLLESSDTSIGKLIFVEQIDMHYKIQQLVCHELTHACTTRLKLPAWLNEGLAMLTVDHFTGQRTVREDTRTLLHEKPLRVAPLSYRKMARLDGRSMGLHVVRGYWVADLMESRIPGFFRRQFEHWKGAVALEREMARILGLPRERFWEQVDDML